jgi:membrane protein required for colicin V production
MEAIGFNGFDALALGIILMSGVMAFARGLLREVFSIVAFIVGARAALSAPLRDALAGLLSGMFGPPVAAEFAAGILIFLIVFIVVTLLTSILAKAVHQSTEIGALDRFAGLAFGVFRGVLILALAVLLMRHITGPPQAPMPRFITDARLYPVLDKAADMVEAVIPQARAYIRDKATPESSAKPQSGG